MKQKAEQFDSLKQQNNEERQRFNFEPGWWANLMLKKASGCKITHF